jgi:outer membrane receptor for ferrienterochelin and colicin
MIRNRLWLVLLAVPLLVANIVAAQGLPTGTLAGRVSESEGLALPGVTVTVKSPSLQGTRTAVTNVNGDYVVPNLPPGDYVATFVMSGFQSATRNVKISASQQVPLNAKLSISAVAAEAMVVAQSETVSQSSQAATTYSTEITNKLPIARTILSSVVLTPGVNTNGPGGNTTVSGAQSFDNVFTVNGVNIQDNIRGTPTGTLVIEDAIQETTTMTSGVSAEYGRFTGGVINAVTKQGGNAFSGSARVTLNNNDWQSQTPIAQTYVDKVVPTYEATLGGPIIKDRIWFFAAGRYNKNEYSGQTVAPTNVSFPRADTDKRYEGKLTLTPFQNHTITGSYTKGEVAQTNYFFTSLPLLETNGTLYDRNLPTDLLSINYNGVLSSNFFVEAQYSAKNFTFENSGSRFNELIKGTAVVVQDRGLGQMFGAIFCAVCPGAGEKRDNEDFLVKGTYFLSTKSLGSHNIVVGYDRFSSTRVSNNWQSGSSWLLYASSVKTDGTNLYPVIDENSYLLYAPIPEQSQGSDMLTNSLFFNDTWRLNDRFSFNVGLRWDKNDATDAAGQTTANDSAFSPRLAANWDVFGDGKLRLTASYATYVGQIQEGIAGSGATGAGAPASYYYYWAGAPINANTTGPWLSTDEVLRRMYAAEGVTGLNQFPKRGADVASVPGVNLLIPEPISSPKTNEYVLGVGGTLGKNVTYRVDAVRREYEDFYGTKRDTSTGQVTDSVGNEYDLGYIVNTNIPVREYTGLHTSLSWRTGNLNLAANWTWSHSIGNFTGETSGSGPVTSTFENYPEYLDMKWYAPKGSLSQDQRHRVRVVGTYDFRLGSAFTITPGLVQSYDTGLPYGAVGTTAVSPFVTNPGYVAPPPTNTYYYSARDAYRTDDVWRTDLSLNLSANLGPVELFIIPQMTNVFNESAVTAPNTAVRSGTSATASGTTGLIRFNPFTTTPVECAQGATAAACKAAGANWQKGPSFGQPTSAASYQAPRRYYIGMGLRF